MAKIGEIWLIVRLDQTQVLTGAENRIAPRRVLANPCLPDGGLLLLGAAGERFRVDEALQDPHALRHDWTRLGLGLSRNCLDRLTISQAHHRRSSTPQPSLEVRPIDTEAPDFPAYHGRLHCPRVPIDLSVREPCAIQ